MPRRVRTSISVRGLSYFRLREWCKQNEQSAGNVVGKWAQELLLSERPKVPHALYEVRSSRTMLYIVASSPEEAAEWGAAELQIPVEELLVQPSQRRHDPDKITYALVGVLSPTEVLVLCHLEPW